MEALALPHDPFLLATLTAVVVLVVWNVVLEVRLRRLTRGSTGTNLESRIAEIARDYEGFASFKNDITAKLTELDTRLSDSVRGVGLVRFNPFAGHGGSKPSFALALVSENGDGVIVSTLHARDSVSIFSKTLTNFQCEQELTDEESQALEKARKSLHTGSH